MAALGDAALGRPRYSACVPYSIPYPCPPAAKGKGAAGGGCPPAAASSSSSAGAASSSFPGYAQLTAAEYFDSYQRAQLMALLSQVSPGFAPRPRRASSRDVAVQVNPRRDVSVQCSLGRRTLLRRARRSGPEGSAGAGGGGSASPQPARRGPEQGSPPRGAPRPVRFPRTVAVYSPVACRRLTTYLEGAEPATGEQRSGAPEGERGPPPPQPRGPEEGDMLARRAPQRLLSEEDEDEEKEEEEDEAQAAVLASWEPVDGPGLQPRGARGGEAAQGRAPGRAEHPPPAGRTQDAAGERLSPRSPEPGKERLRFQFLEQKYGYYHCKDCKIRWESAYVWCVQGTNKVYFKQFCRTCQKSYNPYRVEDITCQVMLVWYMSCSYERGKLTLALVISCCYCDLEGLEGYLLSAD
nr:zygote arrest protein 1 isoform X3 [Manis javanica]